ncbi:hypothetical protein CN178_23485 [Sinorhizobium medicae]|nr:hypothetical protein CN181_28755 [Sinorhizobium medicae]RVJ55714.1 hypothetical protein CN178_23485 [Sinorhizobium medicae]
MPAIYNGLEFRTPLEARWAAFFDLANWEWWVNPAPVGDWSPDFKVQFRCSHSECSGSHSLLVAIVPVDKIDDAGKHPALAQIYMIKGPGSEHHTNIDAGAVFGTSPSVSQFQMSHGPGGGSFDIGFWVDSPNALWAKAADLVV